MCYSIQNQETDNILPTWNGTEYIVTIQKIKTGAKQERTVTKTIKIQ